VTRGIRNPKHQPPNIIKNISSQEKAAEATKQKAGDPKPEEHEDMQQHHHCPPANHRGDRNLECHEEQQKDVA
jgi:hypothetical protein